MKMARGRFLGGTKPLMFRREAKVRRVWGDLESEIKSCTPGEVVLMERNVIKKTENAQEMRK